MNEKVFIYNDNVGVNSSSCDDLKELFMRYHIYESSDVAVSDFNSSFDGLQPKKITIVLPGGSVVFMGETLYQHKTKIQNLFNAGCKGVFICAGAYMATNNADLFIEKYSMNQTTGQLNPLNHSSSTKLLDVGYGPGVNLNIVSDYKAYGPFIPNDSYNTYIQACQDVTIYANVRKPYCVNLRLESTQQLFNQLYLAGCGFEKIGNSQPDSREVVATYNDKNRYSFFYKNAQSTTITNMPAIIRKPGILLSGPHIETCIEDSKLMRVMSDGFEDQVIPLQGENQYDPAWSREIIVPLLRETLNMTRS